MIKTNYQKPELRDANDNIIQNGSFGKNTALANATNDGWIDYTMNNMEALHDDMTDVNAATTPAESSANSTRNLWFSNASHGAKLMYSGDLTYNPARKRLNCPTIVGAGDTAVNLCVDGGSLLSSSAQTGRLIITLPFVLGSTSGFRMMRFVLHVFNWQTREYTTWVIGGGNRINSLAWSYSGAYAIDGNASVRVDLPVAFGNNGTNPYIAIGNADTSWANTKAMISNFVGANVDAPLSMTISDAELQNVDRVVRYNSVTEPAGTEDAHNVPYKHRNLGSAITASQLTEIRNGTFQGINVGDYWSINNNNWIVADIDYFRHSASPQFAAHHVVIVPQYTLYKAQMNSSIVDNLCYVNSELFTDLETTALPIIEAAFGAENILAHPIYMPSACVDGENTEQTQYRLKVNLMNEYMVFGNKRGKTSKFDGNAVMQFSLFRYAKKFIKSFYNGNGSQYWLSDKYDATQFVAILGTSRTIFSTNPTNTGTYVRPYFCIG